MAIPVEATRGGARNLVDIDDFILDYIRSHGEAYTGEIQQAYHEEIQNVGRRKRYHRVTYNSFRCYVWRLKKQGLLKLTRSVPTEGVHGQFKGFDPLPVIHYYSLA